MDSALQDARVRMIAVLVLTAAALGFNGLINNDSTTSLTHNTVVQKQEPQLEIQKQQVSAKVELPTNQHPSDDREKYIVRSGDNMWQIANETKPVNVELKDYHNRLMKINSGHKIDVGQEVLIPNSTDMKDIILPDVEILFSITDEEFAQSIRISEGTKDAQSVQRRRLLNGSTGPTFSKGKFYPYLDSAGNYTIGYGHYLGKSASKAKPYRNGITVSEAKVLLRKDMQSTMKDFKLLLQRKRATTLTAQQQKLLFEMAFNMGVYKLADFESLWKSTNNHDAFVGEIKDSKWYKQVGSRSDKMLSDFEDSTVEYVDVIGGSDTNI